MSDLVEGGYLTRHRVGRRNFYEVHPEVPLRHELVADRTLGEMLGGLLGRRPPQRPPADASAQTGTGAGA